MRRVAVTLVALTLAPAADLVSVSGSIQVRVGVQREDAVHVIAVRSADRARTLGMPHAP